MAEPVSTKRAWKTWQLVAASVVALLLGIGIGGAGAGEDEPEEVATDRATTEAERTTTSRERTTTTRRETTTTQAPYVPAPGDFVLTVIETERNCFGSAGCNIRYEIELAYQGPRPLDPGGTFQLIYEVRGGDDAKVGNIELSGDGRYDSPQDYISTPPNPSLSAVVTAVRQR